MKKNVRVTIEGIQNGDGKESVLTRVDGIYQYLNGKHYVRYEEEMEDGAGRVKNTLKFSSEQVIMIKDSPGLQTYMVFDPKETTLADYRTPYGNFGFQVSDSVITILEEEDVIRVVLRYHLSDQGGSLSENQVRIGIKSIL